MSLFWKLQIEYEKNKTHVTEDVTNKSRVWSSFRGRDIKSIQMILPPSQLTGGRKGFIHFQGYELYNFQIEAGWDLQAGLGKIMAFWFRGKVPCKPVSENIRVMFDKNGDFLIDKHNLEFGKEWGGTAVEGWKEGVPFNKFFCGLFAEKGDRIHEPCR